MNLTPEQLAGLSVMRKERGDPNKRGRGSKDMKGGTIGGKFDISSKEYQSVDDYCRARHYEGYFQ